MKKMILVSLMLGLVGCVPEGGGGGAPCDAPFGLDDIAADQGGTAVDPPGWLECAAIGTGHAVCLIRDDGSHVYEMWWDVDTNDVESWRVTIFEDTTRRVQISEETYRCEGGDVVDVTTQNGIPDEPSRWQGR